MKKTFTLTAGLLVVLGVGALSLQALDYFNAKQSVTSYTNQVTVLPATEIAKSTPVDNSTTTVNGQTFSQPKKGEVQNSVKKIKDLNLDLHRTIELYGQIGMNAVGAAVEITRMNSESDKEIIMLIDSPGGSVISGARLISAMQTSKAKIKTVCVSMCASMAFMIHQYGSERLALDRAILMSHPATVGYDGDVDRIMSFIGTIQRYTNKLEAEVAKRMGLTFDQYKQKIQNEYWVDAEDALNDKVVDGLVNITLPKENQELGVNMSLTKNKTITSENKTRLFDIIWIMPGTKK